MTHGIIKGNLERLGGEDDPLDKFTNDAVFYVARGISMIELYISPDLLNEGEWNAIGGAINWAKDRSAVLSNTHMIGGDPTNREPYGFVHFKESKGILALRNPFITPAHILVHLSGEYGLDPQASNLVLEKVYPYRWISPKLYASGITIDIPLEGYESAVFELYPLQEATEPLVCGTRFDVDNSSGGQYSLSVYDAPLGIRLLNPETNQLELRVSYGLSQEYLEVGPRDAARATAETLEGRCVAVYDAAQYLQYPDQAKREGIASLLSVPLQLYGRAIGTLRIYTHKPYEFSDDETHLMKLVGEQCALLIRNAQLYSSMKDRYENLVTDFHTWFDHFYGPGALNR